MMEEKTCYNCGTPITKEYCEDYPNTCEHWTPKKPMTNGDRIRAMSDEELAKHFSGLICDINEGVEYSDAPCCWLEWLKRTARVEE